MHCVLWLALGEKKTSATKADCIQRRSVQRRLPTRVVSKKHADLKAHIFKGILTLFFPRLLLLLHCEHENSCVEVSALQVFISFIHSFIHSLHLASTHVIVSITCHHGPGFCAGIQAPRDHWQPFSKFLPFLFPPRRPSHDTPTAGVWLCAVFFSGELDDQCSNKYSNIAITFPYFSLVSGTSPLNFSTFLSEQNRMHLHVTEFLHVFTINL